MSEYNLENTITENNVATTSENSSAETITPINGVYYVSQFGVVSEGADASTIINNAIATVVNKGGKLVFDAISYSISKPIEICPLSKESNNNIVNNFDIDFNECEIKLCNNFNSIVIKEKTGEIVNTGENSEDTLTIKPIIYVNCGYGYEERIGVIQNVKLSSGYTVNNNETVSNADTGIYLFASSQISYKNIKILDAKTGVYIKNKTNCEVFMDNIQISKTRVNGVSPLDFPKSENGVIPTSISSEISYDYCNSKNVGIDCDATDCHFSNIVVIDYLVGMRLIGQDNRIYGAHIWNTYCPEQYKHSVGFINGGTNYYTNCVVDHFHIGWLSYKALPFYLTNCHWLNKQVEVEIKVNSDKIKEVYGNEAYAFYIGDTHCSDYSGGGIYANDCHMVGSDLDNEECFTNFCNINNNDINYSGQTVNIFGAPIPNMKKFKVSDNNVHSYENNSTENQYGRIKIVERTISNTAENEHNVYCFNSNDFNFGESNELNITASAYIDKKVSSTGETGTISNVFPTDTTVLNNEDGIEFLIMPPVLYDTYKGKSVIDIDLKRLGYQKDDVGIISFDYHTEAENIPEAQRCQAKGLITLNGARINDYFTGTQLQPILFEESQPGDNEYKTLTCAFKVGGANTGSFSFRIGHIVKDNTSGNNSLKRNENSVKIKNLTIIKVPTSWEFPRYYLENEENYNRRVMNTFTLKNGKITHDNSNLAVFTIPVYNESHPAYHRYGDKLAFVSLPFRYSIKTLPLTNSSNNNRYTMSYSSLGRVCFSKTTSEIDSYCSAIEMSFDTGDAEQIFLTQSYAYIEDNEEYYVDISNWNTKDNYQLIGQDNLRNFIIRGDNVKCAATIALPNCNEQNFTLTNLICNPYGYYFDPFVKIEDNNVGEIIPLYTNGEIRLVMKNAEYSTDLPTVCCDIEFTSTQENNS